MKATETKDTHVREQIAETACRLFYAQGYNLTGINQIIEEAGVAKASLYYHFPSKEDLCVEYLQRRYHVFWEAKLMPFLEGVEDGVERIIKTFECRKQFMNETNFGGCAYIRIISELPQRGDKINDQVLYQKNRQFAFFLDNVKRVAGIPPSRVDDLAATVFLIYDGATTQTQIYQNSWPIENAIKAIRQLFASIPGL